MDLHSMLSFLNGPSVPTSISISLYLATAIDHSVPFYDFQSQ